MKEQLECNPDTVLGLSAVPLRLQLSADVFPRRQQVMTAQALGLCHLLRGSGLRSTILAPAFGQASTFWASTSIYKSTALD